MIRVVIIASFLFAAASNAAAMKALGPRAVDLSASGAVRSCELARSPLAREAQVQFSAPCVAELGVQESNSVVHCAGGVRGGAAGIALSTEKTRNHATRSRAVGTAAIVALSVPVMVVDRRGAEVRA